MSSKFKRIISIMLVVLVFTFTIFNTQLVAFATQTDALSSQGDTQVLFTYDSDIFALSTMTVDLSAMSQEDEAFASDDVVCRWYKDGVLVAQSPSYTFKMEDVESTFNVEVIAPDKTALSYNIVPVELPNEYGYSNLSDNEKIAYDAIEKGVTAFDEKIEISPDLGLDIDTVTKIVQFYLSDNPESLFFTDSFKHSSIENGIVLSVYPVYHLTEDVSDKTVLMNAQAQFKNKLFSVISQMYTEVEELSDYNKALWAHDKVCDLVDYVYTANDQSAYGALIEGQAVCAGYAKLFDLMLKCAGIQTFIVKGFSYSNITDHFERHAWSLMWLDGKCLYADSTWDDQKNDIYHVYFARSLKDFSEDHVQIYSEYEKILPSHSDECDCMQYFEQYASKHIVSGENYAKELADVAIQCDERRWDIIAFDPSGDTLVKWLNEQDNLILLMRELGLQGRVRFKINRLGFNEAIGSEVHVTLQLADPKLSGTVTKNAMSVGDISIKLLKDGDVQPSYETTINEDGGEFSIDEVAPGKYTVHITQKGCVDRKYDIDIKKDTVLDIALLMLGDVNDDDKVTVADATYIQRYIAMIDDFNDENMAQADSNKDGKISVVDATVIQRFVAKLVDSL